MANNQVRPAVSIEKLKACIAYVCNKDQAEHALLDHIKLNKVLWYADTASYMEKGDSITGGRFVRKPHGPVAKFMSPAVKQLIADGVLTEGKRFDTSRGVWADTYELTGDMHNLSELSEAEKKFLDAAFKGACLSMDSATVSERTHGDVWEIATSGEDIPLFAMYAECPGRITQDHIKAAFGR